MVNFIFLLSVKLVESNIELNIKLTICYSPVLCTPHLFKLLMFPSKYLIFAKFAI